MKVCAHYIVTKSSNDGTFEKGDKVKLDRDKNILSLTMGGWVEPEEVEKATNGWEIALDEEWLQKTKDLYEKKLSWLYSLEATERRIK